MTVDPDREPLPEKVGPYRLGEVLGEGGMGVVVRAVDAEGRPAAVKLLHYLPVRRRSERARFEREASIRLDHPNVVRVLDAGVEQGVPWIAFELLPGETLAERLKSGALSVAEALDVVLQAARGLEAAHAQKIVHRDLKPSNLFLCEDGTVKIIDFGIARLDDEDTTRLTATGNVLGTPTYLSPEQASGARDVDERTDVWALGVLTYEALAGRSPFDRPTSLATMLAVMVEQPASLGSLAPHVPPELVRIVERCLEKKPSDRFPSVAALRVALEAVESRDVESRPMASAPTIASPALPARMPSITPGEQRVVAVLLADALNDRDALRAAIEGAGGAWLPVVGDRAIGLFGGEAWEGDEVERAAGAALEARHAAAWLSVASGRASYSGATGIAGTALSAAEAGIAARTRGVALDAQSARALSERYTLERVGEDVFEIVERISVPVSILAPPSSTTTVGREAEIAQLVGAMGSVVDEERPVAVLVTGPPGVGKSHLRWVLGRLLDERGGFRVLSARPEPGERRDAFAVFRGLMTGRLAAGAERGWPSFRRGAPEAERLRAVRSLVEESVGGGAEADALTPFFAELLGLGVASSPAVDAALHDPMLMRDRIRLAIEDWLAGLGEQGPLAIVLEDLQWVDDASLELIEGLVAHPMELPILLFATARPEIAERRPGLLVPGQVVHLSPRGLTASEVARLAATILGRELSPPAVRALAERTAGNPLFVEQIVLAMRETGAVDDDLAEVPLPLDVEAAVQSRFDHLPPGEKDLCKRAAVFGRPFTTEEIEAAGVRDPRALLSALMRRDILAGQRSSTGREYRFRSTLVRDVAYRMIAPGLRAELHLGVATMLATRVDPDLEETALHFERAGEEHQAARWYGRAALGAARRGDAPSVLRCAERVIALGTPPDLAYPIQVARGEAFEVLGRLDEQDAALDDALLAATGDAGAARVLTDRAVWLSRHGRRDEAIETAERAVEAARRAGDDEALAVARGRQAAILTFAGRLSEAREACDEASRLAATRVSRLAPLAAVWRAQLASARGDLVERREAYEQAVSLYQEAGDLRRAAGAEMNLADAYNRFGAYAEARSALEEALGGCRRLGIRLMEGYALANLGYALTMLGEAAEALGVLGEAADLAGAIGERRLGLSVRIYRARALLRAARPDDAQGAAHEAVEQARALADEALEALALGVGAAAKLDRGDAAGAVELSERAMALRDRLGSIEEDEAELFLVHARALEASGRADEAASVRARGRERVQEIAARIADPELRRGFLEDVEAHRALG